MELLKCKWVNFIVNLLKLALDHRIISYRLWLRPSRDWACCNRLVIIASVLFESLLKSVKLFITFKITLLCFLLAGLVDQVGKAFFIDVRWSGYKQIVSTVQWVEACFFIERKSFMLCSFWNLATINVAVSALLHQSRRVKNKLKHFLIFKLNRVQIFPRFYDNRFTINSSSVFRSLVS